MRRTRRMIAGVLLVLITLVSQATSAGAYADVSDFTDNPIPDYGPTLSIRPGIQGCRTSISATTARAMFTAGTTPGAPGIRVLPAGVT